MAEQNTNGTAEQEGTKDLPGTTQTLDDVLKDKTMQTLDDVLKDKTMQAEFDRRMTKAVQTAQAKAAEGAKKAELTVEELKKQLDAQNSALTDYVRRESAIKAGVDPKFLKFVTREVADGLADGADYETSLAAYIKANPQFVAAATQQPQTPPPSGWGQQQQGAPTGAKGGVEAAFQKLNPNLKLE